MKKYTYSNCKGSKLQKRRVKAKIVLFLFIIGVFLIGCGLTYRWYNKIIAEIGEVVEIKVSYAKIVEGSVEDRIKDIARDMDFKEPDLLVKIAFCESSFNEYAVHYNNNGTVDQGVLQFNSIHGFEEKPLNLEWSVKTAIEWIRDGRLNAWNATKNCWSK